MADSGGTVWVQEFFADDFWSPGFWSGIVVGRQFEGRVLFHCASLRIMYHPVLVRLMLHAARGAVAHTGVCRTMIAETS